MNATAMMLLRTYLPVPNSNEYLIDVKVHSCNIEDDLEALDFTKMLDYTLGLSRTVGPIVERTSTCICLRY